MITDTKPETDREWTIFLESIADSLEKTVLPCMKKEMFLAEQTFSYQAIDNIVFNIKQRIN
jgi:hypothetical protein